MKKSTLIKLICGVLLVGLVLISFNARDALIDMGAIDYTESEIIREFNKNRSNFDEVILYIKNISEEIPNGIIKPLEKSRYIKEKTFGHLIPSDKNAVFSTVMTKYFSKIEYKTDKEFLAVFYSPNEQILLVYENINENDDQSEKNRTDLGDGWFVFKAEPIGENNTST